MIKELYSEKKYKFIPFAENLERYIRWQKTVDNQCSEENPERVKQGAGLIAQNKGLVEKLKGRGNLV